MDIGDTEGVAVRLDRCAEAVEGVAREVRAVVAGEWRGAAAEAFTERVLEHHAELVALADRIRRAARLVRDLGTTARRRVAAADDVLPGAWR